MQDSLRALPRYLLVLATVSALACLAQTVAPSSARPSAPTASSLAFPTPAHPAGTADAATRGTAVRVAAPARPSSRPAPPADSSATHTVALDSATAASH